VFAAHARQLTVPPDEDHVPSIEDLDRVTVGPYDPAVQYQVYEVDAAEGTGLIVFV